MWKIIFLCFLGLCSGSIISIGIAGLLISLSIVPHYAGFSHTGNQIHLYESITMLGILYGNLQTVFYFPPLGGRMFLLLFGLCSGIFLGTWILSLEEIADVFPIISRRLQLQSGFSVLILSLAFGKLLGSLCYFYYGWQ